MRSDTAAGPHRPGALPNLIVAGFAKCGTGSLHSYLDVHPEVAMSWVKEVGFFCAAPDPAALERFEPFMRSHWRGGNNHQGLGWYRSHFDPSALWRGESTPAYTTPVYPDAPRRIATTLPDARVLLIARDPVDRACSRYHFRMTLGTEHRSPAEALVNSSSYLELTEYTPAYERLVAELGVERVRVVSTEDLAADPAAVMNGLFAWLGLEGHLEADAFAFRELDTATLRSPANRAMVGLRRLHGWGYLQQRVPDWAMRRWQRLLAWRASQPPEVPAAIREHLAERLAPDAARFRVATGLSLRRWSV